MPDEQLFALAESGKLLKPEIIKAEARRMLKDPKSKRFTTDFAAQWLGLKKVAPCCLTLSSTPTTTQPWKCPCAKESELSLKKSFATTCRSRLFSIRNSLCSTNGLPNTTISPASRSEFRKVSLPRNSPRGGILTHASVLTITSNGTRTSPVVRESDAQNIFDAPNNPPPDIEPIEPDIGANNHSRNAQKAPGDRYLQGATAVSTPEDFRWRTRSRAMARSILNRQSRRHWNSDRRHGLQGHKRY